MYLNLSRLKTLAPLIPLTGLLGYFFTVLYWKDASWELEVSSLSLTRLNSKVSMYTYPPAHVADFITRPSSQRKDYREWNQYTLMELYSCMALQNCGPNQQKVVLLASGYIIDGVVTGQMAGEPVWGKSVYNSLRALGYTALLSRDLDETLAQYRMFPDFVKVVMRDKVGEWHDNPNCVKGPGNPDGIPAWKLFDFEYWPMPPAHGQGSRLGGPWILSSQPQRERDKIGKNSSELIQYIGFSIEEECLKKPLIPLNQRENRIWLFMKKISYVYEPWSFAWERWYLPNITEELEIKITGGWVMQSWEYDPNTMHDIADPARGIINLGPLDHDNFVHEVGTSKVMLGVGNPHWSPSPYNALCQGVPFIHPIRNYDQNDPHNKEKWDPQQPSLIDIGPPYVYPVLKKDYDGLIDAIKKATTTEIGRFIPDFMTEAGVRERLTNLLETDWRSKAEDLLRQRLTERDSYIFEI